MEHSDALAGGTAQVVCCEQGRVGTDVIFTPPMGLKGRRVAELNIESQHRSAVTAARAARLLASNADEAVQAGKSGEDPTSTRVVTHSKFRNNVFWVSCFWTCLGCVVCLKLFSPIKCKDQREGLPALRTETTEPYPHEVSARLSLAEDSNPRPSTSHGRCRP